VDALDRTASGVIDVVGHPSVDRVFLDGEFEGVVPTAGIGNTTHMPVPVVGTGFGHAAGDVLEVIVGGVPTAGFQWVSSTEVLASIPAGVGANIPVVVRTRGGILSSAGSILYHTATVTGVFPEYLLSGKQNVSLELSGTDLGNREEDLDWIKVGLDLCHETVWVSPQSVRCLWIQPDQWVWD